MLGLYGRRLNLSTEKVPDTFLVPARFQLGGRLPRFARVFDVGRMIGIDRNTKVMTSFMTIVTEADGTLVTAFPGKP
jgi:hypothetical protein